LTRDDTKAVHITGNTWLFLSKKLWGQPSVKHRRNAVGKARRIIAEIYTNTLQKLKNAYTTCIIISRSQISRGIVKMNMFNQLNAHP